MAKKGTDEFTVDVDGAVEIMAANKRAVADLMDLQPEMSRSVQIMAAEARPKTPRKTGKLAGSVSTSSGRFEGQLKATAPYGKVVHYGYPPHNMKAQPWLSEAATGTETRWVQIFRAKLEKIAKMIGAAS